MPVNVLRPRIVNCLLPRNLLALAAAVTSMSEGDASSRQSIETGPDGQFSDGSAVMALG